MRSLNIVQDDKGHVLRVEYNGVELPVSQIDIDQTAWPGKPVARLTLALDDVTFTIGEVDTSVVDADMTRRLIEPPQED